MKGLPMKLMQGLLVVFLLAFFLTVLNYSVNDSLMNRFEKLHGKEYVDLQHSSQLLLILDEINLEVTDQFYNTEADEFSAIKVPEALHTLFQENLDTLISNVAVRAEKELLQSISLSFRRFTDRINSRDIPPDARIYFDNYYSLRQITSDYYHMKDEAYQASLKRTLDGSFKVLTIQKYAGIAGMAVIGILVFILPVVLNNKIDSTIERLMSLYKIRFGKSIVLSSKKQLDILEEIVDAIVTESGKTQE